MTLQLGQIVYVRNDSGVVRYIGTTGFAPGNWVGIELDHVQGKNDGSIDGKRYFNTEKQGGNYGIFVRETMVSFEKSSITHINGEPTTSPKLYAVVEKLQNKLQHAMVSINDYRSDIDKMQVELRMKDDEIHGLKERIEMVEVNNEFNESSVGELQMSLTTLQEKYEDLQEEYLTLQEEVEINKQIEDEVKSQLNESTDENVLVVLQRNKQLELALESMHNISKGHEFNLKNEIDSLTQEVKDKTELSNQLELVKDKLRNAEAKILNLQDQLDSTLSLQSMVENLTTENEQLKETLNELTKSIDEMTELDKSIEEDHKHVESRLQADIENLSEIVKNDKQMIDELKLKLSQNVPLETNTIQEDKLLQLNNEIEKLNLQLKQVVSLNKAKTIEAKVSQAIENLIIEEITILQNRSTHKLLISIEYLLNRSSVLADCILEFSDSVRDKLMISTLIKFISMSIKFWEFNCMDVSNPETVKNLVINLISSLASSIDSLKNEEQVDLNFIPIFCQTWLECTSSSSFIFGTKLNLIFLKNSFIHQLEVLRDAIRSYEHCENYTISVEKIDIFSKSFNNLNFYENDSMLDVTIGDDDEEVVNKLMNFVWKSIDEICFLEAQKVTDIEGLSDVNSNYAFFLAITISTVKIEAISLQDILINEGNVPESNSSVKEVEVDSKAMKLELIEKNRIINELQLNIQILERNTKAMSVNNSEFFDEYMKQVSGLQQECETMKKKLQTEEATNYSLKLEIKRLESIKRDTTPVPKSRSMNEEINDIEKNALKSQIELLKQIARLNSPKPNVSEIVAWLSKPLLPNKFTNEGNNSLLLYSKRARELTLQVSSINIGEHSKNNLKHYNLVLKERLTNLDASLNRVLN
ncbi:uncharacterized protein RJT21DRAFT_137396 [Scheffersomyces amazonensis]|uniref:uncharacterized protein n=1 Tax=Scheffersomyces amazonensis TaxID=1078765 RepID=UPI00315D7BAA